MNRLLPMVLLVAAACPAAQCVNQVQSQIGTPVGSFFALLVASADESALWYREKLGFKFIRKSTGPDGASHTVMLENNGVLLEIIEHRDSFALATVTRNKESLLRGVRKVGLVVSASIFDQLFRSLTAQKVEFVGGEFEDAGLGMRSFIVYDNSGNLVQLFTSLKSPTPTESHK